MAVRNVVAPAPQQATSDVRCMMSTFCEVTECPAQHSSEVNWLGAKGQGFAVVADFQHMFSLLVVEVEDCQHCFCSVEL